jgi:beta-xylosidase
MKKNEIALRDPFILPFEGYYYMTGTRAATCWGEADGFDGYVSQDLDNWDGPFEIFHRPDGFAPDRNYWAPEIHLWKGSFYLFATFGNSRLGNRKGTMILKSDAPLGPYHVHSDGWITPKDWNCLDGTFYVSKDGNPYMVFSHEWVDIGDGEIMAMRLSEDLTHAVGQPRKLFAASMAKPWVRSIKNRQWNGPIYVTDGPFLYRKNDKELLLLWASFGENGYAEAIARSDSGEITGNWSIDPIPLFADNGGHGMIFRTFEGKEYLVLHRPNETPEERPVLIPFSI